MASPSPVESLSVKQRRFAKMFYMLQGWLFKAGYEFTWGETKRGKEQAEANAASGAGISNSLHLIGLAADINLFDKGVYQTDSKAYEPLGIYWESIGGSWGGRFKRPDGNHFSLEHNGVR